MPAQAAVTNVAKMEILQTINNVPCVNILHFLRGGTIAAGDVGNLAEAAKTAWQTNMLPVQTADLRLTAIRVTDLSSLSGQQYTAASTGVGSLAGSGLPANACLAFTFSTAVRSRSSRGRMFLGGLSQSDTMDPQHIAASRVTQKLNAFEAFRLACQSAPAANAWTLAVVSYYTAGAPRVTPVVTTVTSVRLNNRIDSQRRRLGR
jgi:hypothetical protein